MFEATTANPFRATSAKDALTEVVRVGAQRMLTAALEAEVQSYIEDLKHVLDERGHRLVVRNGHLPGREITTGIGPLEVRQPRVNDRRVNEDGERLHFTSSILPPYLRRTKSIDDSMDHGRQSSALDTNRIEEGVSLTLARRATALDFDQVLARRGTCGLGLPRKTSVA